MPFKLICRRGRTKSGIRVKGGINPCNCNKVHNRNDFEEARMKKKIVAMIAAGAMIASMIPAVAAYADETETPVSEAPDYSKEDCWYQIPEITKDVDTFYIPATEYVVSSFEEGAPDYAELGNADVMAGAPVEYEAHASAFQDSTNVFMPYYRQAGLRFAAETWQRDGTIDAAISGIPYDDISSALSSLRVTARVRP